MKNAKYSLLLPPASMVVDLGQHELIVRCQKDGNVPDIVYLLFVPLLLFFLAHPIFIFRSDWSLEPQDLIVGAMTSMLYISQFRLSYTADYGYSTSFRLALEASGILFAFIITEIVSGRGRKLERNTIITCLTIPALSYFFLIEPVSIPKEVSYWVIFCLISFLSKLIEQIIFLVYPPVKLMVVTFGIVLMYAVFYFTVLMPYEIIHEVNYIRENIPMLAGLSVLICTNIILKYFTLRMVDLDVVIMFTCLELITFIILRHAGLLT